MTTDLILVEAVPALSQYNLSNELQEAFEDLFFDMTTPPEGLDDDDWRWAPDVIKIKTATTTDSQCPGSADVGDIWAAGEVLWSDEHHGKKNPWKFIPIFQWKSHSKFVHGQKNPDCSSPDGKTSRTGLLCAECPHLPWEGSAKIRQGSNKTACDRTLNFLVLAADLSGFYELRFRSTSEGAGKNILRLTKRRLWGRVFGLHTISETKGTNTWQKYATIALEDPVAPEVQAFAQFANEQKKSAHKTMIEHFASRRADIDAVLEGDDDMDMGDVDALEAELADDSVDFSETM